MGTDTQGNCLALTHQVGKGTVISLGSFMGMQYYEEPYRDFEKFVLKVADKAAACHQVRIESEEWIQWRSGLSGNSRLLFLINPGIEQMARVNMPALMLENTTEIIDLLESKTIEMTVKEGVVHFQVVLPAGGYSIVKW